LVRVKNSGHIIKVSSFLGLITLPVLGLTNISKFAGEDIKGNPRNVAYTSS